MRRAGLLGLILLGLVACQSAEPPPEFYHERARIHFQRAMAYYQVRQLPEALEEALKAKEAFPDDPEIYNLIGLILTEKQDYEGAIENLKKALELDPNFSGALNNLGSVYLLKGDTKKAIELFEKALENPLYTKPYVAYTNLAWAYYQEGNKEKAVEFLDKALASNPRYHLAYFYRGLMALNDDELEEARLAFRRALRFNRQDMASRYYLGLVYYRLGRIEKAVKLWRSVLQLAPDSEWALKAEDRLITLEDLLSPPE